MKAEFAISADERQGALLVTMSGFFAPSDVNRFTQELRAKLAMLSCPPNEHVTLCDVRQMKIQTQDIVAAFTRVVGAPQFRSKRLAFVTGSSLARLQTKRLTSRDGVCFFQNREDAKLWLFTDMEPPNGK